MENRQHRSGGVEFVCPVHVADASDAGYCLPEDSDGPVVRWRRP